MNKGTYLQIIDIIRLAKATILGIGLKIFSFALSTGPYGLVAFLASHFFPLIPSRVLVIKIGNKGTDAVHMFQYSNLRHISSSPLDMNRHDSCMVLVQALCRKIESTATFVRFVSSNATLVQHANSLCQWATDCNS
ncbi:hypothetical protein Mapa_017445 [Marchantia paleacea]|nr:hypothetical protein Mapa_017445 [Marchantia paleacea]